MIPHKNYRINDYRTTFLPSNYSFTNNFRHICLENMVHVIHSICRILRISSIVYLIRSMRAAVYECKKNNFQLIICREFQLNLRFLLNEVKNKNKELLWSSAVTVTVSLHPQYPLRLLRLHEFHCNGKRIAEQPFLFLK